MSTTVEERVVEMRFDNQDFEKNIQTSMSTLGDLKKALNMDGVTQGLEDVQKATKGIDLSGISSGIDAINDKFSTLGIVGKKIVSNLVDDAYQFVKKTALAIPNFIQQGVVQGGIKRAMNIEQAKFQLEGLHVAWQDISEDIDYAVSGTAYGLDSAAKAASQLVASGVEFGETFGTTGNSPMAKALRGISGVAAMTNRDYDEIARIFTTVAGNGRMMGDQLNQLGERGINAAATLKDFFNDVIKGDKDMNVSTATLTKMADALQAFGITTEVTEADIRQMASKSLISFDIFSEAMDNAFGEHAKDANKTFTGAMSNIKAALSRVGADYVSPLIQMESSVVNLLNAIRTRTNDFRKYVSSQFAPGVTSAILGLAQKLADFMNGDEFLKVIRSFGFTMQGLGNILKGIGSIFKPIGQAFIEVFAPTSSVGVGLLKISNAFRHFTENLRLNSKVSENLKNTFKGIFSIISIVLRIVGSLTKVTLKLLGIALTPLLKLLGFAADKLLFLTGIVGKYLSIANDWIKKNDIVLIAFNTIVKVVTTLANAIKNLLIRSFNALSKAIKPIKSEFSFIKEFIKSFTSGPANKVKEFFSKTFGSITIPPGLKSFLDSVKEDLLPVGSAIKTITVAIKDFLKVFFGSTDSLSESADNVRNSFKSLFDIFVDFFNNSKSKISGALSGIKEFFSGELKVPDTSKLNSFKEKTISTFDGITSTVKGTISSLQDFGNEEIGTPKLSTVRRIGAFVSEVFRGIRRNIGDAIDGVSDFFSKLFGGFDTSSLNSMKEKVSETFEKIKEAIKGVFNGKKSVGDALLEPPSSESVNKFKEGFIKVIKTIYEEFKRLTEGMNLMDIIDTIVNLVVGVKFAKVFGSISKAIDEIKEIFKAFESPAKNFSKILENVNGILISFKEGSSGIQTGIKDVLDSASKSINTFTNSIKADILKKVAISIGILTAALIALSLIEADKLKTPLMAVTALLGELILLMAVINKTAGGTSTTINKSGFQRTGIQGMAATIAAIGATLIMLALALKTIAGIEDPKKLDAALQAFTAIILELSFMMLVMSRLDTDKMGITKGIGFWTMGQAIVSMANAIKILSSIDSAKAEQGLQGFIAIVTMMSFAFAILSDTDDTLKNAVAMVVMGAAIEILAGVIATLGVIPWSNLENGLIAMLALLAEMVFAFRLIKNEDPVKTAAGMVVMGAALMILTGVVATLGVIPWSNLIKGLVGLMAVLAEMVFVFRLVKNEDPIKTAAAMVIMGAALMIFTAAIATMGAMPWQNLLIGLAGLFGVLMSLVLVIRLLSGSELTLLVFADSIAAIGLGVALVGAGLLAFALALDLIAVSGTAAALVLADMVKILIEKLLDNIVELKEKIKETILTCVDIGIETFKERRAIIAEGLLTSAIEILDMLNTYGPEIASKLMDFLIGVLDAIQPRFPELVDKVLGMLETFLGMVSDRFDTTITDVIQNVLVVVLGIEAAMFALVEIAKIPFTVIIKGLAKVGVAIAMLTGILAAIGGLNQIPGLNWLVQEGGELLESVGNAIGKFVGGIIGGFGEGLSASLPQIGKDLSSFMEEASGFIAKASELKSDSFDGIKSLAEAMLILTADELLHGITGWLTGGNALVDFGKELAAFTPELKTFIDNTKDIDDSAVASAGKVFDILSAAAKAAKEIPNTGGLLGELVGNNDLGTFGEEMAKFAPKLNNFITDIKGTVDEAAIKAVECAINILTDVAKASKEIPNTGGLLGKFVGNNDLSKFGQEMSNFAPYLVSFCGTIKGVITKDSVTDASYAVKILSKTAKVAQEIPNTGGILAKFIGDSSLVDFGKEMNIFAPYLVSFCNTLKGNIDKDSVTDVSRMVKMISKTAKVAKDIPNTGGILAKFIGDNSLSVFASEMAASAPDLVDFADKVKGKFNDDSIDSAVKVVQMLADIQEQLNKNGGFSSWFKSTDIGTFGANLKNFGAAFADYAESVSGIDTTKLHGIIDEINSLLVIAKDLVNIDSTKLSTFGTSLKTFGQNAFNGFIEAFSDSTAQASVETAITTMINSAITAMTNHSEDLNNNTKVIGENVMVYLNNGLVEKQPDILETLSTICKSMIEKVRDMLTKKIFTTYASLNVGGGLIAGLTEKKALILSTVAVICKSIITNVSLQLAPSRFRAAGAGVISGLADGMNDNTQRARVTAASRSVCVAIISVFTTNNHLYWEMRNVGANAMQGLSDGIDSKLQQLRNKVRQASESIVQESKKGLNERSPSREMFTVGAYAMMGLINGFVSLQNDLTGSVNDTTDSIVNPIQDAIAQVADLINYGIDAEPTIRPVLDLSDVQNGIQTMNGMLPNSFNMSTAYGRALRASITNDDMFSDTNNQNGQVTTVNNFTQNNYSPKALSRNEIYRQTKNQFAAAKGAVSGI